MIDFTTLAKSTSATPPESILGTFQRLDRQVSHVELRPSQIRTLEVLSARISERDLVVKLNTGGGKTTIGLLYLKHLMDKYREPVAYLVPNVQLAGQVLSEADNIGLPAFPWKGGESHPPEAALRSEGVIVCTYDKFFNGRSTFARQRLTPCAVVFDDVHAGIESIKAQYSARLPGEVRSVFLQIFANGLRSHDPVTWGGIENGSEEAMLEVPFWVQDEHQDSIADLLSRNADADDLRFSWPNISQDVDRARIFLSGDDGFITCDPPGLERLAHFANVKHRLFMSASVHDGAILVRELGCSKEAALNPVDASGEASVGERMVIVPSLIDPAFSDSDLVEVALRISRSANVVVLVPSFAQARKWEDAGAVLARPENITNAIQTLKTMAAGNVVVFAQRYDGVDLPDQACRLLVIDGLPLGDNLADRQDAARSLAVAGARGKVAIKIEQGLGRPVRSSSDYAAVILAGRDVATFVSRTEVLKHLSPFTVRQIEIGRSISNALRGSGNVKQGLEDTITQLLRRDAGWKAYYAQEIAKAGLSSDMEEEIAARIENAHLERSALRATLSRDYPGAFAHLQRVCDSTQDRDVRGVVKQMAARYQHFFDRDSAMRMQVSAYGDNPQVNRPPMLLPVSVRRATTQAEEISRWLQAFDDRNGPILELGALRSRLSFGLEYRKVEEAVRELGVLLGADSSRPDRDFGRGPDNLWVFGAEAFILEIKNEKRANLTKSDAEQLQSSVLWVQQSYPHVTNLNPVIVSNVVSADVVNDFAFGARVWTQREINELVDGLEGLASTAVSQGELFASSPANIQGLLSSRHLLPGQIRSLGAKPS